MINPSGAAVRRRRRLAWTRGAARGSPRQRTAGGARGDKELARTVVQPVLAYIWSASCGHLAAQYLCSTRPGEPR